MGKDDTVDSGRPDPIAKAGGVEVLDGLPAQPTVRRFGRYIVLDVLGRGGMGVVLKCYDEELDRKVAVKVLHEELGELHTTRLRREARAMAKLSHPHVVQVYEVGELEGRTYVAMELVKGLTLREWMSQEPRPGWRECVDIFLQLGSGLAAAHANGLVHRDFKPGNAIIDEGDRARLLDFGLARRVDDGSDDVGRDLVEAGADVRDVAPVAEPLTRTGAILGTPAYMPLEQMNGREADARSDQFSFCVSLYEALYGERPYSGHTLSTLMMSLRNARVRPAPKGSVVPIALRRVVVRGVATDPGERWPSMEAVLDELRRQATPPRRRWVLPGLVVAVAGLGGSWALGQYVLLKDRCSGAEKKLVGVWDDGRRARLRDAILGTKLSYAEDTWNRVERALDEYAGEWVDMHADVCEATNVRRDQSEAVMDLRMGCLRGRLIALREAVGVLVEAAPDRLARAVPLVERLPSLSRCEDVETLQAELPPPEEPKEAERVEALRERLAEVRALRHAGAYDEALKEADAVLEEAEELDYAPLRAESLLERGEARQQKAQYEEAERDLEESFLLAAELGHGEVASNAVRELAIVVGHDQARHEAGLQWGKMAIAFSRRAHADPLEEALALSSNGMVLMKKGELGEALTQQQQALSVFEKAFGPESPDIANLYLNMGNVLHTQGRLEEALVVLRRSLEIQEKTVGPRHPIVAAPLTTIGVVLIQQGEGDAALEYLQQALSIREEALGAQHPDVATSLNNLGAVYKRQGVPGRALEHFERAQHILEEALGAEHPRVAYPLNNIGEVLRGQGDLDGARAHFERALVISEKALGDEHPDLALSSVNLANVLLRQDLFDEAERRYQQALEIQEATLPLEHPHLAWPLLGLARVGLARKRPEQARAHAERAVAIREKEKVAPELLAEARFVLARALWSELGEQNRARMLAEQARDGWATAGADDERTKEYLGQVDEWLAERSALSD